jgi:hypothetical protein
MEEDTDEEGLEEDDDEYVTSMPSCLQNNPIDQLA